MFFGMLIGQLYTFTTLIILAIALCFPFVPVWLIAAVACLAGFYKYYSWLNTLPQSGTWKHVVYMYIYGFASLALTAISITKLGLGTGISAGIAATLTLYLFYVTFNIGMSYIAIPVTKKYLENVNSK